MTVGEKIQQYRKQLKMSQDELGQRLLVSRQTVSLWEKDQTLPTIDNLIRLKEIFGVSVDNILGFENSEQTEEASPVEACKFSFSKEELKKIHRMQMKDLYKKLIIFITASIFLIIFAIGINTPDSIIYFIFGAALVSIVFQIKTILAHNSVLKKSAERVCRSTYEYKFFEDYLTVSIYRNGEKIREAKCCYTDIEKIQPLGSWLTVQFGGQLYIIKKDELKENSAFFSYMYSNPSVITKIPVNSKLKTASDLLFAGSLLSIFIALALISLTMNKNGPSLDDMWLFFLPTPLPIASVIFGFVMKKKGYKFQKNIIAGIIMTALLCIYGSFTFIF